MRDWTAYRDVFTDEIDLDYSSYRPGSGCYRFRADDWSGAGQSAFSLAWTRLSTACITRSLVTINGDVADIVIYVQAEHFLYPTRDGDNWFTLGGYYSDRLVRQQGEWKISGKSLS